MSPKAGGGGGGCGVSANEYSGSNSPFNMWIGSAFMSLGVLGEYGKFLLVCSPCSLKYFLRVIRTCLTTFSIFGANLFQPQTTLNLTHFPFAFKKRPRIFPNMLKYALCIFLVFRLSRKNKEYAERNNHWQQCRKIISKKRMGVIFCRIKNKLQILFFVILIKIIDLCAHGKYAKPLKNFLKNVCYLTKKKKI